MCNLFWIFQIWIWPLHLCKLINRIWVEIAVWMLILQTYYLDMYDDCCIYAWKLVFRVYKRMVGMMQSFKHKSSYQSLIKQSSFYLSLSYWTTLRTTEHGKECWHQNQTTIASTIYAEALSQAECIILFKLYCKYIQRKSFESCFVFSVYHIQTHIFLHIWTTKKMEIKFAWMYFWIKVDHNAMSTLMDVNNVWWESIWVLAIGRKRECTWEREWNREREKERESGVVVVDIPWTHIMMHATSYTVFAKVNQCRLEN